MKKKPEKKVFPMDAASQTPSKARVASDPLLRRDAGVVNTGLQHIQASYDPNEEGSHTIAMRG